MAKDNTIILLALALFFGWVIHTNREYNQPVGYSQHDRAAMDDVIYNEGTPRFKTKQAAVLADLWHVTNADLDNPVNLW